MKSFRAIAIVWGALGTLAMPAAADEELTVYATFTRDNLDLMAEAFKKVAPDIELTFFRASGEELSNTFITEMERGISKADYIMGSPDHLNIYAEEGYLLKYSPPGLDAMMPGTTDPNGFWVPFDFSVQGIIYNTRLIPEGEAPKSFQDLLDPKWKGKIGMTDPRTTGSPHQVIRFINTTLKEKYGEPPFGWSYFENFLDQEPRIVNGSRQLLDLVVSGEILIALSAPTSQIGPFYERGEPIKVVWPKEGVPADQGGGAIVATSDNIEAAKRFHDFVASKEGHEFVVREWRTGVSRGDVVSVAPDGTPFADLSFTTITVPTDVRSEQATTFGDLYESR